MTTHLCESGACIEIEYHAKTGRYRLRSTFYPGKFMQCSPAELIAWRDRLKAGELDHLDEQETTA